MTIFLDFETRGVVDLKKCGATRYAQDPLTQVLCFCWSFDQSPVVDLWHRDHPWITRSEFPQELCERIASGELVEAHNAGFEMAVWWYTLSREFPEFREFQPTLEQMRCSAAKASCVSLPRALDEALHAIHAPAEFLKLSDGKRLIQKLSKPRPKKKGQTEIIWCEEEIEHRRNWEYCAQDIRAERYLSDWCPDMTERELEYWQMDQRMNQRGIALDSAAANRALKLCASETARLDAEMLQLTDGQVPGGAKRAKFRAWMNGRLGTRGYLVDTRADTLSFALHGVPTKAGEAAKAARKDEMVAKWAALGDDAEPLRRSMDICMEVNRTSNSKYKTMLSSVCADGRLHDIMLYNGADRPVSGDAEVLTRQGWQRIDGWAGGDIAQWAHQKGGPGEITFGPATRAEFPYTGDMVRMAGPSTELLCTLDHKIPLISCRDNLSDFAAGNVRECNWALPLAGNYRSGVTEPPEHTRLVVMYQADGRTPDGPALSLHFRKQRKIDRCKSLLRATSLAFEERIDSDGSTNIKIIEAPEWLCRSKEFGEWLLNHNPAVFIAELEHWDGTTDKRNTFPGISYSTRSKNNAEWVQTMAALAGTRAHIEDRGIRNPGWNRSFRVHVHNSGARSWLKKNWSFKREPSSGTVYCARTQTGYFLVRYNGTIQVTGNTGRWSGKGVQPHNFVRGYSKEMSEVWDDILALNRDGIEIMWGNPLPALAKACRGALIASPGYELYAADFNAIEARKLAWMANCIRQLELFSSGGDPYIAMACGIYKLTGIDYTDKGVIDRFKKEHADERQLGKRAVLGLGYAMGWEKFQATVWAEEGIWLDDEFCQMVVSVYRKQQCPEMPVLWKTIGEAAIKATTEGGEWTAGGDPVTGQGSVTYFMNDTRPFLHCRLPSGRLLAYLYPEVHTKLTWRFHALNEHGKACFVSFPSKRDTPQFRARWHAEKMAEKQRKKLVTESPETFLSPHLSFMGRHIITRRWQRIGTHGGSLTENADQASSRDLLAEAMYRVDLTGVFRLLLSIHDEVIAEAPIGTATRKEFEALMSEVPIWATGMSISAEGWIGQRLRK